MMRCRLVSSVPGMLEFREGFPGLELDPGELAALRLRRVLGSLVRLCQACGACYGLVYTMQHGGASGLIVGLIIAWLIGRAAPGLPDSVVRKIDAYLQREQKAPDK